MRQMAELGERANNHVDAIKLELSNYYRRELVIYKKWTRKRFPGKLASTVFVD